MTLPIPATDQNFWIPQNASALIYGLNLSYASASTINFTAGNVLDSQSQNYINVLASGTLSTVLTGVLNGLDTGVVAVSSLYYVYAIGCSLDSDDNPSGLLCSLSATSPVMPKQLIGSIPPYDMARLIGFFFTDGSANILKFYQYGNQSDRTIFYDTDKQVITSGTATALTAVNLSTAVPPINGLVIGLRGTYTPATAGDHVNFAPGASTATVLPSIIGQVAAVANSGSADVVSQLVGGVPEIQYINSASAGSTNAWVQWYKYSI